MFNLHTIINVSWACGVLLSLCSFIAHSALSLNEVEFFLAFMFCVRHLIWPPPIWLLGVPGPQMMGHIRRGGGYGGPKVELLLFMVVWKNMNMKVSVAEQPYEPLHLACDNDPPMEPEFVRKLILYLAWIGQMECFCPTFLLVTTSPPVWWGGLCYGTMFQGSEGSLLFRHGFMEGPGGQNGGRGWVDSSLTASQPQTTNSTGVSRGWKIRGVVKLAPWNLGLKLAQVFRLAVVILGVKRLRKAGNKKRVIFFRLQQGCLKFWIRLWDQIFSHEKVLRK